MRGHWVQVRGRNQPNLLSNLDKGKLQLGDNRREKQNPVIEQRRLSEMPVSILGPTTLGGEMWVLVALMWNLIWKRQIW